MHTLTQSSFELLLRRVTFVLAGVGVLTASSYVSVPMLRVPITLQTLAVILVGALAGPRTGLVMIVSWLSLAAAGFPVLADGKSSLAAFVGPTAGFLLAFPVAGFLAGVMVRSLARGHVSRFASFLGLHAFILFAGWAWLATLIGADQAFAVGVAPFLIGAVIKSGLGTAIYALFAARTR